MNQDERDETLKELAQKETSYTELEKELERYRECDPEVLENMKKETLMAQDEAT